MNVGSRPFIQEYLAFAAVGRGFTYILLVGHPVFAVSAHQLRGVIDESLHLAIMFGIRNCNDVYRRIYINLVAGTVVASAATATKKLRNTKSVVF